jgi:TRAP-type uncharacterized transport system fused permease subunit
MKSTFDNFLKGPISSILGIIIMGAAIYAVIDSRIEVIWEGAVVFALGFMLLFMRDSMPEFIKRIFTKKLKD